MSNLIGKKTDMERRISVTDYAQMNSAYIEDDYTTHTGRRTTWVWLRSAYSGCPVHAVSGNGDWYNSYTHNRHAGLCPSLHYYLPSESEELEQFDIREVKGLERKNYISYITYWGICKNKSRRRFE